MQLNKKQKAPDQGSFCNPNNPTGTLVDPAQLKEHAEAGAQKTFVFIDEAYTEYADIPSLATWAVTNPNVVVAKTFSKVYGLAGARVGYAVAHPDTIKSLSIFQPWPDAGVSMVSCNAALASLDDHDFVKQCREKAKAAREMCYDCFHKLSLEYIPSATNFVLFNIDKLKGALLRAISNANLQIGANSNRILLPLYRLCRCVQNHLLIVTYLNAMLLVHESQ